MLKKILSIALISFLVVTGCKTVVDPDNASAIAGTYRMTVYNTQAQNNNNPAPGNEVDLTKIDKNTVKGLVRYSGTTNTVDVDNLAITKSGSIYNLSKTYSNATASGSVNGNTLQLNINYNNGTYAHITAVK